MRRPYIAGNWKMNTTESEARELARSAAALAQRHRELDIGIAPPFPHLAAARDEARGTRLIVAGQDLYWEASGAFTGEVSATMLRDYCTAVIIGHSERRHIFGENDEQVHRKTEAALNAGLLPIVCVGETIDERRAGRTFDVLGRQVREGLGGLPIDDRVTIAYEPVWAIGTGETATPETAQDACAHVRALLGELFGEVAGAIRIQYGGSVNPGNAAQLLAQADIDGALVGGASLKAEQFAAIVEAAP